MLVRAIRSRIAIPDVVGWPSIYRPAAAKNGGSLARTKRQPGIALPARESIGASVVSSASG